MKRYPTSLFEEGDVVFDELNNLLLVVTHVMHNPTLPIFKVFDTQVGYRQVYNNGVEMSLKYSSDNNLLHYVCEKSSLTRIFNHYKVYHRPPSTALGRFLRNFETFRACEEQC